MDNKKEDPKDPAKVDTVEDNRENNKKDGWDKAAILLRPTGGLFTAFVIAYIGFIGSRHLEIRQEKEQRTRLYTELISQREESESALRKDMFTNIIGTFLKPELANIEEKVLQLELLVYNFHESFNLKSLFIHLLKQIEKDTTGANKTELKNRLKKAAEEITAKQLAILDNAGETWVLNIFSAKKNGTCSLLLNEDSLEVVRTTLELDGITRDFTLRAWDMENDEIQLELVINKLEIDSIQVDTAQIVTAGNHKKSIKDINGGNGSFPDIGDTIEVTTAKDSTKSDEVTSVRTGKEYIQSRKEIGRNTAKFWVGFFDFPMVDNTRLSDDQRCAIVMNKFDTEKMEVEITLVYFPGSYASLKDKPYYQEVIDNLVVD